MIRYRRWTERFVSIRRHRPYRRSGLRKPRARRMLIFVMRMIGKRSGFRAIVLRKFQADDMAFRGSTVVLEQSIGNDYVHGGYASCRSRKCRVRPVLKARVGTTFHDVERSERCAQFFKCQETMPAIASMKHASTRWDGRWIHESAVELELSRMILRASGDCDAEMTDASSQRARIPTRSSRFHHS